MVSAGSELKKLAASRILVVGDLMLDRYWFGDVERISPEAPVPVVQVNTAEERMGGAGNVARNVNALGGKSGLIGVLGDDSAGFALRQIAEQCEISHNLVVDAEMPTCVKQRIVARHQQLLRADFEQTPNSSAVNQLVDQVSREIEHYDVMVLSDYGKGSLSRVSDLIQLGVEKQKPVLVDPKGADFSRYRGAYLVTPNLKELELVAGKVQDDTDLDEKASRVVREYQLGNLLVTLSERGMKLFSKNGESLHSPARSREVFDVSGAGDTVIGVMAMCVGAGLNMSRALHYANIAAGIVVSRLGTATASIADMHSAIEREQLT